MTSSTLRSVLVAGAGSVAPALIATRPVMVASPSAHSAPAAKVESEKATAAAAVKAAPESAKPPAKASAYRFATVIKTQSLREVNYSAGARTADAKLDTQLVYSPAFPDLESCKAASAEVSQLLGAPVTIKADLSSATATYKNSGCMPTTGLDR